MNINEFINKFEEYPILFIGSGLSLRYRKQSYNWDDLLKKISEYIYDSDEKYKLMVNSIKKSTNLNNINLQIAQRLDKDLLERINDNANEFKKEYPSIFKKYIEEIDNNFESISLLKIIISDLLKQKDLKEEYNEEIQTLKKASKNVLSIVTTNYDDFIEENLGFTPIIGNNVILKNPYGSVYKIHGTIKSPESIIITEEDYEKFEIQYDLIKSVLIYSFIHNPIIFLGYSIQDRNIQNLLQTIFQYIKYDSDIGKKIRNNFLIVEYNNEEDKDNLTVLPYDLKFDSTTISINKIKTNRFKDIYDAISNLQLPISAMDVKKVKNVLYNLETGGTMKVHIEDNIEELDPKDKIIAIGSANSIQYSYKPINDIIKNYLKYNSSEDTNIMKCYDFDKISYNKNQYFPILNLIATGKIELTNKVRQIMNNQIKKIKEYEKKLGNRKEEYFNKEYKSIEEVYDDKVPKSYIEDVINYNMQSLKNEEIENFIKKRIEQEDDKDNVLDTKINKMISCYDYKCYNEHQK